SANAGMEEIKPQTSALGTEIDIFWSRMDGIDKHVTSINK
ncbi:14093_t:CDS:1, partial [Acaulospora colombiana]